MKKASLILVLMFAICCTSSCSKSGADDLDGLQELVVDALVRNKPRNLYLAYHFKGAAPEVKSAMHDMILSFDFSNVPEMEVKIHTFANHQPDMELPGFFNGRELAWLVEPTHWVVARSTTINEFTEKPTFSLTFAATEIDGKWRFVGSTYADADAVDVEVSIPGLTDMGVTAIVLNADGSIMDFVQVKEGSDIDWIEFHAPENGDWIHVGLIGPEVHPEIPSNAVYYETEDSTL